MKSYRIAVIPGDGIGKEVVPEGIRVLEAAGRRFDIKFKWDEFPWSCETYTNTGRMMPKDGIEQLRTYDAIFLGAVGFPGVPDHVSLWGLLIPIRRQRHCQPHRSNLVGSHDARTSGPPGGGSSHRDCHRDGAVGQPFTDTGYGR